MEPVATNLVFFSADEDRLGISASAIVAAAEASGIRFLCIGGSRMRMVTHHQISGEAVERALEVIQGIIKQPGQHMGAASAGAASYAAGKERT